MHFNIFSSLDCAVTLLLGSSSDVCAYVVSPRGGMLRCMPAFGQDHE